MSAAPLDLRAQREMEAGRGELGVDDYELPPIESYVVDAAAEQTRSGDHDAQLAEATCALELVRRVRNWAPRAVSAALTVPPMPPAIIDRLILPGTVAIGPGEGGAGKSTLYQRMAMSIATGTEFLEMRCELPGTCVHLFADVIAEVKLTHPRRSNFDPPGRGWRLFSSRRDVDPGASGGDQGIRTARALDSADHARDGAVA